MTTALVTLYTKARADGWRAVDAIRHAHTMLDWRAFEARWPDYRDGSRAAIHPTDAETDATGRGPVVRLACRPDESADLSYLDDASVFTARARAAEYERANRDGVWCIDGEYWSGSRWEGVDSVGGFVGADWRNSGYDSDIMRSTLTAALEHYATRFPDFESLASERD